MTEKDKKIKEYSDRREWHVNGKLHREDGPAVEYADGAKEWFVNGKFIRRKYNGKTK